MKKFGTPSGAAPGSEKEKVGFAAVGTPVGVRRTLGFGAVPPLVWVVVDVVWPPVKPLLLWLLGLPCLPLGCLPLLLPPLLLLPDPCEELEPEPLEVLELGVEVVEGGGVGVDGAEAHDSETEAIGALTGSDSAETGVPGGTLTLNVSFWPPTTVTVTTH